MLWCMWVAKKLQVSFACFLFGVGSWTGKHVYNCAFISDGSASWNPPAWAGKSLDLEEKAGQAFSRCLLVFRHPLAVNRRPSLSGLFCQLRALFSIRGVGSPASVHRSCAQQSRVLGRSSSKKSVSGLWTSQISVVSGQILEWAIASRLSLIWSKPAISDRTAGKEDDLL